MWQAAIFFAVLGKEKKLLALAKADRGFVGQRQLSGQEGDINANSGQGRLTLSPVLSFRARKLDVGRRRWEGKEGGGVLTLCMAVVV